MAGHTRPPMGRPDCGNTHVNATLRVILALSEPPPRSAAGGRCPAAATFAGRGTCRVASRDRRPRLAQAATGETRGLPDPRHFSCSTNLITGAYRDDL